MRWIRRAKAYPANWHYLTENGNGGTSLCGMAFIPNGRHEYRASQNLMRNNICSRCRNRIIEGSALLREAAQLMKKYV